MAFALPAGAELIEALHRVQQQQGWLAPQVLAQVAQQLALPGSRVQGVASFYHLFALRPPPRHRCDLCLGTACFVRGAGRAQPLLQQALAAADWAINPVGCVGACGLGPVLLLDGELHGPVPWREPQAFAAWIDRWRTG